MSNDIEDGSLNKKIKDIYGRSNIFHQLFMNRPSDPNAKRYIDESGKLIKTIRQKQRLYRFYRWGIISDKQLRKSLSSSKKEDIQVSNENYSPGIDFYSAGNPRLQNPSSLQRLESLV